MSSDNTNLGGASSESALTQPSTSIDDPLNLNFWEPEKEANSETSVEQESTDETVETVDEEPGQETDEAEAADSEEDGQSDDSEADPDETDEDAGADVPEVKDDHVITLQTGDKVPLAELKLGYLRQSDYTRKTQAVKQTERELGELSARVNSSVDAIADLLIQQMPPAPDFALSQTNPMEYMRRKAVHDAAQERLQQVLQKAGEAKEVVETLDTKQREELIQTENAKLVEAFPMTATQEGRKQFFEQTATVARELGYTDQDLAGVTDHRLFKLAYYANLGMKAEQAKAKAAKKVENVAPVAAPKRQASANGNKAAKNKQAMQRLAKTGSIMDALQIDFE